MDDRVYGGWGTLPALVQRELDAVCELTGEKVTAEAERVAKTIAAGADFLWEDPPGSDAGRVLESLARGIAILACRRHGVTFHGRHWCARPHADCGGWGELEWEGGRGTGVVYTPVWMAERVTSDVLDAVCARPGPLDTWDVGQWRARPLWELTSLRVADIACGSGVFLVAAAEYLSELVVQALARCGFEECLVRRMARVTAVKNCIYGVDADRLAVDIARLCLALMVPLDEVDEAVAGHVVCGDSLVGPGIGTVGEASLPGRDGVDFRRFPEIAARGGFDAVIGNPPFLGGHKITGALGSDYREWLVRHVARGVRGSADLAAYFTLRAYDLVRDRGQVALITPNTIGQGATRRVGLEQVVERRGGTIWQAVKSAPWPTGRAALEYAVVWISRGPVANAERQLLACVRPLAEAEEGAGARAR